MSLGDCMVAGTVVDGWWLAWRVGHDRISPLAARAWDHDEVWSKGGKGSMGDVGARRPAAGSEDVAGAGSSCTSYAGQSTDGCFTPLPEYELDQQVNSQAPSHSPHRSADQGHWISTGGTRVRVKDCRLCVPAQPPGHRPGRTQTASSRPSSGRPLAGLSDPAICLRNRVECPILYPYPAWRAEDATLCLYIAPPPSPTNGSNARYHLSGHPHPCWASKLYPEG
jgi:hypothetical protein